MASVDRPRSDRFKEEYDRSNVHSVEDANKLSGVALSMYSWSTRQKKWAMKCHLIPKSALHGDSTKKKWSGIHLKRWHPFPIGTRTFNISQEKQYTIDWRMRLFFIPFVPSCRYTKSVCMHLSFEGIFRIPAESGLVNMYFEIGVRGNASCL